MEITNKSVAKTLKEAAACYKIKDESANRFQIIAYERAAESIEHLTSDVKDLFEDNKLSAIPGVGPAIRGYIEELIKTGKVKHFESLKKGLPVGMFTLLDIPGIGAKTAYKLAKKFNLNNPGKAINSLEIAILDNKIAKLPNFGEKSQKAIQENIQRFKEKSTKSYRMPLCFASEIAKKIVEHLKKSPFSDSVEPLGSLRRRVATIGDIDIAVATNSPKKVIEWFVKYPKTKKIIEKGDITASIIVETGAQVDLMVQPTNSFGSLLQHFTGSKNHNIRLREYAQSKNLSLSEYGIKRNKKLEKFSSEIDFYRALKMDWIPPELREDSGEVEASLNHKLPNLLKLNDIKGDLQIHSNYDVEPSHDLGENSMKEIIQKAKDLGYDYIGFSEHNPSVSKHTNQQIIDIIKKRNEYIEHIKDSTKFTHIFSLLEVDILPDGSLATPDEALKLLDGCMISIHSVFEMTKEQMTQRIVNAMKNPYAKFLAHPTGRIIGQRIGYDADWEKIFQIAKDLNKAIEINAAPQRLDLPDTLVREAINKGVKLIINTDAHSIINLDMMPYGVSVARRGWATKDDIINCMSYDNLLKWFKDRR